MKILDNGQNNNFILSNKIILLNSNPRRKLQKNVGGKMSTSKIYRGGNVLLHRKQSGGKCPRSCTPYT